MTPIKAASAAKPPVRRQSAARLPSLARYGVRAVDTGNDTQKTRGEATYTAPTLRSACSPSSCKLPMSGVEGNAPRPSLGDTKGVFSSRREYPLCLAAAQRAALTMQRRRRCTPYPPRGRSKRDTLFGKRIPPFFVRPIQISILTPCVSMVMMLPAMATPSRMTGTARFRRISSTAAMSAPVHAPVPGSGMATKSSSPHV